MWVILPISWDEGALQLCPGHIRAIKEEVTNMNIYTTFNSLRPRQMDAISQTTFSNAFSWMKMFEFR